MFLFNVGVIVNRLVNVPFVKCYVSKTQEKLCDQTACLCMFIAIEYKRMFLWISINFIFKSSLEAKASEG